MRKSLLENYMEEEEHNMLAEPEEIDDIPSVKLDIDDNGLMKIELTAFYHGPENGKIPLLINNPALQEVVMKAIQLESQKAFRRAVHGVLGIPYGLPENKKNKTMTNEVKLWQRRAGLLSEGDYMKSMEEAEKELTISDKPAADTTDKGSVDVNQEAILKLLQQRLTALKTQDTPKELSSLLQAIISMIQDANNKQLSDQEVIQALRGVLSQQLKPMNISKNKDQNFAAGGKLFTSYK